MGSIAAGGDKAIKPEGTMLSGPDLAHQLENLKDSTSEYSRVGPVGYVVPENGPPLGPSSRSGRSEFVAAGCAKGVPDDRRKEIVDRMDCEQCHDRLPESSAPATRGILNAGTSRATIYHKVVKNTEAPMPPGVNDPGGLTAAEREILFKCLRAEYAADPAGMAHQGSPDDSVASLVRARLDAPGGRRDAPFDRSAV